MATIQAIYPPDYPASQATGLVGTIAVGAVTAAITIGKYRLFKITFLTETTPPSSSNLGLRFTTGISDGSGASAPVPTAASPLLVNNQENVFEMSGSIDQIRFANLAIDNGATNLISYCILPLTRV